MSFIVDMIIDSIIRAITYAIVVSVSNTIHTSIKKSVTKNITSKMEAFLGADGEIDEDRIASLIKVQVAPMELGQYSVRIDEEVFDIMHDSFVTPKDTTHLNKLIVKDLTAKKMRAKFRKNNDQVEMIELLLEGFKK